MIDVLCARVRIVAGALLVLACGASACGGASVTNGGTTTNGGGGAAAAVAGGAGQDGGIAGTPVTAGGAPPSGGACTPPSLDGPPNQIGCYVDTASGWLEVPCNCELPVANATPQAVSVSLQLTVTPSTLVPSLTGVVDVEISVADADSSWYRVWAAQPGSGTEFAVSNDGATTKVRLGTDSLSLSAVPLAGCDERKVISTVDGDQSAGLSVHGALTSSVGAALVSVDGACQQIPHP
jgi:hypothetical protein